MVNQISDPPTVKTLECERIKNKSEVFKQVIVDTNQSYEDSFSVSNLTKQLEAITKSLEGIAEVNEARVLYFKAALASNTYAVNCEHLATKMLQLSKDL
ncbi:MAG: hypothetical protein BGO90_05165 [Legionella sp. 40-6]|nr:flagellar biosynthesis anti-sigma factor FlgM [Legionella sp.]OJY13826.1 MAG: hypothetical protein BGO90_05165 [Legionella sp. 40-6]